MICFKLFSKFPIGFKGFQIMCFKIFLRFQWFSNDLFQTVFKIPQIMCFIGFNGFQIMCFKIFHKVFSNFPICFNGFQIMCFKFFHRFQWFSNDLFQNVFKFPHRFQWFSKLCLSKCFQISP